MVKVILIQKLCIEFLKSELRIYCIMKKKSIKISKSFLMKNQTLT